MVKSKKMRIITDSINLEELKQMAAAMFGNSVKAVADTAREFLALDAELPEQQEPRDR